MQNTQEWYVRSAEGKVYGPADLAALTVWAEEGRIDPSGFVSNDCQSWLPAQLLPELDMSWVVESEPGKFYGPFNRKMVSRLSKTGAIPEGAVIYRRHNMHIDEDPAPEKVIVEKIVEKIVEVEKIIEVEPSPRRPITGQAPVLAVASRPPVPVKDGIFKNINPESLAALEEAVEREIAAAKCGRMGAFNNLFSRRKP